MRELNPEPVERSEEIMQVTASDKSCPAIPPVGAGSEALGAPSREWREPPLEDGDDWAGDSCWA